MNIAKENWCSSQVEMLKRLFECEKRDCEYKCVGCEYLGKASDAPKTVKEECMWVPSEKNGDTLPCEEE